MKVAHYIYTSSDHVYGGPKSQLNFIEEVNQRDGFEIVAVLYKETDLVEHLKKRHLPYAIISPHDPLPGPYRSANQTSGPDSQWWNFIKYNIRFRSYLIKNGFDLVHYNNLLGFLLTRPALQLTPLPTVLHVRSKPRKLTWYWIVSLSLATRVVCVSNEVYDSIKDRLPGYCWRLIKKKTVRIYNGIRLEETQSYISTTNREDTRSNLGINTDEFAVGYIASIDERKNQLGFLRDIVSQVSPSRKNIRFYFLGSSKDDAYKRRCMEYVSENNLQDICSFKGYQHDIKKWYVALDAVTLYSQREGLPRTVLEAMSFGKPVITNATTGVREIITNGQNGFVHESPDVFTNTIFELAQNEDLRHIISESAKNTISDEFSITSLTEELLKLYIDLKY